MTQQPVGPGEYRDSRLRHSRPRRLSVLRSAGGAGTNRQDPGGVRSHASEATMGARLENAMLEQDLQMRRGGGAAEQEHQRGRPEMGAGVQSEVRTTDAG